MIPKGKFLLHILVMTGMTLLFDLGIRNVELQQLHQREKAIAAQLVAAGLPISQADNIASEMFLLSEKAGSIRIMPYVLIATVAIFFTVKSTSDSKSTPSSSAAGVANEAVV
jgi:hypothetical protein